MLVWYDIETPYTMHADIIGIYIVSFINSQPKYVITIMEKFAIAPFHHRLNTTCRFYTEEQDREMDIWIRKTHKSIKILFPPREIENKISIIRKKQDRTNICDKINVILKG